MKRLSIRSLIRSAVALGGCLGAWISQAQPTISSVFPDGSYQLQYSPVLSFTAAAAAGVTNVAVQLSSSTLLGQSSVKFLTSANGLTITGPSTSANVTAALKSNMVYTAVIRVDDSNGLSITNSVTFDTVNPSYTFEAEDWNYTENSVSGQYFDNPQTNAYAGKDTAGADAQNSNGNNGYRPGGDAAPPNGQNGGLATETTGDKTRTKYLGTGFSDYNIGWTDGGDWANYTRHFPAGTFNIYIRAANPNNPNVNSAEMSGAVTGQFGVPNTGGWQTYSWIPLRDAGGNLVEFTSDGSEQTIMVTTTGGSYNANYYMFLPPYVDTGSSGDIAISDINPDGAFQFQPTNLFSFSVTSSTDVNAGNILVVLNATNLLGEGSSQVLTSGNGLTVGGTPTSRTVSLPITSNTVYSVAIQVSDINDNGANTNLVFDTISPAYLFEIEDWNYGGGAFIDNPQTNAYSGLDGVSQIDYNRAGGGGGNAYGGRIGLSTENAADIPRATHSELPDFNIGNSFSGNWANYTRTFPAGVYNIYVRVSRGDGGSVANAGSISQVTSGADSTDQTTSLLGTFMAPGTGGWQHYVWVPVRNVANNLVRFTGGGVKTLRYTVTGGGHNVGCVLLMPADLIDPPPFVSDFAPDGSAMFQFTNRISFVANSAPGLSTNNVIVEIDGTPVSALTFNGSSTAWNVVAPVTPNALHTAIITLTDVAGTSHFTNAFTTLSATNYQWEAEDYDYGSGQHFENVINAYAGLGATAEVDVHSLEAGGTYVYRTAGTATEPTGDTPRDQFTGFTDYNIGFFEGGEWQNYTHQYPAGTYHVYARMATGGGSPSVVYLEAVTSGVGTVNQTTNVYGRFLAPVSGWGTYTWVRLNDLNGQPVAITLDGAAKTLRMERPTDGSPGANINFMMLAATMPVPNATSLTVVRSGANIHLSFPTENGFSYQLQYKNSLSDSTWTDFGSALPGNGAVQSINDSASIQSRFYRIRIQ